MVYHPVAASSLLDRYRRPDGTVDFTAVPVQDFGSRDNLQRSRLAAWREDRPGVDVLPPRHQVPTVGGFNAAVGAGLGWGMIPAGQLPDGVLTGTHPDLVVIPELGQARVPLHWQRWSAGTPALDRLTAAVQQAARNMA
jgi:LysR family transcriptional regulator, chromosome initiation inhibitor